MSKRQCTHHCLLQKENSCIRHVHTRIRMPSSMGRWCMRAWHASPRPCAPRYHSFSPGPRQTQLRTLNRNERTRSSFDLQRLRAHAHTRACVVKRHATLHAAAAADDDDDDTSSRPPVRGVPMLPSRLHPNSPPIISRVHNPHSTYVGACVSLLYSIIASCSSGTWPSTGNDPGHGPGQYCIVLNRSLVSAKSGW